MSILHLVMKYTKKAIANSTGAYRAVKVLGKQWEIDKMSMLHRAMKHTKNAMRKQSKVQKIEKANTEYTGWAQNASRASGRRSAG
jgi:hypothetical protein